MSRFIAASTAAVAVAAVLALGVNAWAQVLARGCEGLVAKDDMSRYVGGRTFSWLKVKQPNWTVPDDRWTRTLAARQTPHR